MTISALDGGAAAAPRASAPRASWWPRAVFLVTLALVAAPLVFLVLGSLSQARLPSEFSIFRLGIANYAKVWSDPGAYATLSNTLVFAAGSTIVGVSTATVLAWLVVRTDMPGKIWIQAGVPMTLAMPGMLQAMAWVLLASPRIGLVNKGLMAATSAASAPVNIYSLGGMIFVEGLRAVPTAFLMLAPLLRAADPSLEEAAAMSGARAAAAWRRVTLRLMLPGLLAVSIYQFMGALEEFEVAGILGLPAGVFVFSTKIYAALHPNSGAPAYGEANALAIPYLAVAVLGLWLYARAVGGSGRHALVSGKGYRPSVSRLGAWRGPAAVLVAAYLLLSVVVPFLALAYVSLLPFLQPPTAKAFAAMSLDNYAAVFASDGIGRSVWNTVAMTLAVATVTIVLSFAISMVVTRSDFRGRFALDKLAFLPHAIPGMVMGLALLWLFLQLDKLGAGLFGTLTSIVIAFVIGYIPYGTRALNAAIIQVHADLEEAAKVAGAPGLRVQLGVFLPLLAPALAGVWIWTVLHVVRSPGKPLILSDGPDSEVLAVTIWNMWDQGYVEMAGAVGAMTILALFVVAIAAQWLASRRRAPLD